MGSLQLKRSGPDTCAIVCEHCGKGKALHYEEFRQLPQLLKVRCGCGQVSELNLDRRRFTRSPVQLTGTLYTAFGQESLGPLTLFELSLQGVGFIASSSDLEIGQTYCLSFELDDESSAVIEKDILVRHVRAGGRAGAEFVNPEDYDFALDLYLMSIAPPD